MRRGATAVGVAGPPVVVCGVTGRTGVGCADRWTGAAAAGVLPVAGAAGGVARRAVPVLGAGVLPVVVVCGVTGRTGAGCADRWTAAVGDDAPPPFAGAGGDTGRTGGTAPAARCTGAGPGGAAGTGVDAAGTGPPVAGADAERRAGAGPSPAARVGAGGEAGGAAGR